MLSVHFTGGRCSHGDGAGFGFSLPVSAIRAIGVYVWRFLRRQVTNTLQAPGSKLPHATRTKPMLTIWPRATVQPSACRQSAATTVVYWTVPRWDQRLRLKAARGHRSLVINYDFRPWRNTVLDDALRHLGYHLTCDGCLLCCLLCHAAEHWRSFNILHSLDGTLEPKQLRIYIYIYITLYILYYVYSGFLIVRRK